MITAIKIPTQFELKKNAYASDLKSRALNVLLYLVDRTNKELTCFPSLATIGKQLHISISTVKRAMKELLAKGFLERIARFSDKKNGGQTSNLYTLSIPQEEAIQEDVNESYTANVTADEVVPLEVKTANTEPQTQATQHIGKEVKHINFTTLLSEQKQCKQHLQQEIKAIKLDNTDTLPLKQDNSKPVIRNILTRAKYHKIEVFRLNNSNLNTSILQQLDGGGVHCDIPLNLSV